MEHRTQRDSSFLNLVSDFETNFEKGINVIYDQDTFLRIIRYYEEELQYDKAIEVAVSAIDQYPSSPDFYIIRARLLFQSNLNEEAIEVLEKAEKISPYELDILLLKVRILAFQGSVDEARNILKEMKRYVQSNDLSDVYLSESYIKEVERDYHSMYESLTKSVICDIGNEEALERIGFAVQLSKNYKSSIQFHQMIINEQPFSYLAWYNLGHAYSCIGEYNKAINALEYSFITEPNFENGYLDCADICIQEKRFEKALDIYEGYLEVFGINEEVLVNMAECRFQIGNLNKAKTILNKLLKLDPYNDEVYYKLGLCYAKAENWNKAIDAYHKAITLEDGCEDYYLSMAIAHNAIGSFEKAEFFFGQAVEMGPEQSQYWKEYISFLIKVGKKEKALQVFSDSDDYTFGADLLFCRGVALYLNGDKAGAFSSFEEGLKEDYDQHKIIFDIEPELSLDKELNSMIKYYEGEVLRENI